jgi:hypothetical protein
VGENKRKTYLQWVGIRYYPTPESFIEEAKEYGVSKRLSNFNVAKSIAIPGTVVFLAHSSGLSRMCLACSRLVVCPTCSGAPPVTPDCVCGRCKGLGSIELGTGGHAVVDGERWDYLRYIKLRRAYKHDFWKYEHEITDVSPCKACGGRGNIPSGKVFGAYTADSVFRVGVPGELENEVNLENTEIDFVPWEQIVDKRRPGNRKYRPGYYAKTVPTKVENPRGVVVENCDARGYGSFMVLEELIAYNGKQFRGVKRWSPLDNSL